jgi:hypothetical protein
MEDEDLLLQLPEELLQLVLREACRRGGGLALLSLRTTCRRHRAECRRTVVDNDDEIEFPTSSIPANENCSLTTPLTRAAIANDDSALVSHCATAVSSTTITMAATVAADSETRPLTPAAGAVVGDAADVAD